MQTADKLQQQVEQALDKAFTEAFGTKVWSKNVSSYVYGESKETFKVEGLLLDTVLTTSEKAMKVAKEVCKSFIGVEVFKTFLTGGRDTFSFAESKGVFNPKHKTNCQFVKCTTGVELCPNEYNMRTFNP